MTTTFFSLELFLIPVWSSHWHDYGISKILESSMQSEVHFYPSGPDLMSSIALAWVMSRVLSPFISMIWSPTCQLTKKEVRQRWFAFPTIQIASRFQRAPKLTLWRTSSLATPWIWLTWSEAVDLILQFSLPWQLCLSEEANILRLCIDDTVSFWLCAVSV